MDFKHYEVSWLQDKHAQGYFLLITTYRPPSADELVLLHVDQHLEEALRGGKGTKWTLVEEFQCPPPVLSSSTTDRAGQVLKDIAFRLVLQQVVKVLPRGLGIMRHCGPSTAAELYSSTICNLMAWHIFRPTITIKPGVNRDSMKNARGHARSSMYLKMRCQLGEATKKDYLHSPDNILAIVLKMSAPEHAMPLSKLFQYSYNTGIYLIMWKIAQICPLCKNKSNLANYRPISLHLIRSKVMVSVINSAIKQHLLSNNLLSDAQFGFRQDHSAPELITALVQMQTKELDPRGE
eukprot:g33741.t1